MQVAPLLIADIQPPQQRESLAQAVGERVGMLSCFAALARHRVTAAAG